MRDNPIDFPRCEFHSRFYGTTLYKMEDAKFWGTYYRSQDSRIFKILKKENGLYDSPGINIISGNSAYAHSGGHSSPFKNLQYASQIKLNTDRPALSKFNENIRDIILNYKANLCKFIQTEFEKINENNLQPARKPYAKKPKDKRPIVSCENKYPCILVRMPIFNKDVHKSESTEYWFKHPKPMQKLIIACFLAIINKKALAKKIPIEMVMRAGFGHHLPSVDETGDTFRINIGLIPRAYAELIAESLKELYDLIESLDSAKRKNIELREELEQQISQYNSDRKAKIEFRGTIWDIIQQPAQDRKDPLLAELFRAQYCVELFADYLIEAISETEISARIIDQSLERLFNLIEYGKRVTMQQAENQVSVQKRKWPEEIKQTADDKEFWKVIKKLFDSLLFSGYQEGELLGLYSKIEEANMDFYNTHCNEVTEDGFGSDSDFEFSSDTKTYSIFGKKIRLQTGMKAAQVALYSAQLYLKAKEKLEHNFNYNTDYMYYETPEALEQVVILDGLEKNTTSKNLILFYDLNHFNKENKLDGDKPLEDLLSHHKPIMVVLDYTSATHSQTEHAISCCLSKNDLLLLVGSGIKHDQAGADINPYGELRIVGNDRKLVNVLFTQTIQALNGPENKYKQKNEAPATTHRLVKAYKKRGHAFTFFNLYPKAIPNLSAILAKDSLDNSSSFHISELEKALPQTHDLNESIPEPKGRKNLFPSQLSSIAKKYGMQCIDVERDGNCFYHAVAHQLETTQGKAYTHSELRKIAADYIANHKEKYNGFYQGSTFEEYLSRIRKLGEWVDHPQIDALSNALNINVIIIQDDGKIPPYENKKALSIYLGYEVDKHYQSMSYLPEAKKLINSFRNSNEEPLKQLNNMSELINIVDIDYHCTLLNWAAIYDNIEATKLLLSLNADPCIESLQKRNPLHYACRHNCLEIVKLLSSKFPQLLTATDSDGYTPLQLAENYKHEGIIQYLKNLPEEKITKNMNSLRII